MEGLGLDSIEASYSRYTADDSCCVLEVLSGWSQVMLFEDRWGFLDARGLRQSGHAPLLQCL